MLRFEEVSLTYRARQQEPVCALAQLSTEVQAGELVVIYGPSGSGKTTLLQLAAGLLRPDKGRVLVAGRDVSRLNAREGARYRKHELGFVTQSFSSNLLPGASALDNAALKAMGTGVGWREARRQVSPLLDRFELGGKLKRRAAHLSMGERQRVAIVRALSTKPKLLLADEPTSSLDSRRSRDVLDVLRELCHEESMAAVVVTHDPETAAFADRVHSLRDGQLLLYGSAVEDDARIPTAVGQDTDSPGEGLVV